MRIAALLLLLFANHAYSEEDSGLTLYPHLGKTSFNNTSDIDNDGHWGLGLGYRFDNPWAIELMYQNTDANHDSAGDVDVDNTSISALYHLKSHGSLTPYVSLGYGRTDFDSSALGNDDDSLANLGFGLKWYMSENVALRGDFKYFDGTANTAFSLGLHWAMNAKTERARPAPVSAPAEGDADRDGVADSMDQCPGTPRGVEVDSDGCPLDDDGDSVPNYKDECPNTTNRNARIDSNGCYVKLDRRVNIHLNVEFDFDSSTEPHAEHIPEIRKVADFMNQYPDSTVVMEGHTDSRGDAGYNMGLSERRAKHIADSLVQEFGISGARVSSKGYGETQPIATNDTDAGRQKNRRVVAVVEGQKEEIEIR
jgi:OOP family OmpA-OmpF porin